MTLGEAAEGHNEATEKELRNQAVIALKEHGLEHPVGRAAYTQWWEYAELRVDQEARRDQSAIIRFSIERAKLLGEAQLYVKALEELDDAKIMATQHDDEEALARIEKGIDFFEALLDRNGR